MRLCNAMRFFQFLEANVINASGAISAKILLQQDMLTLQVSMASKIYFLTQFFVLSKTEKSHRVTESHLVCVGLKSEGT